MCGHGTIGLIPNLAYPGRLQPGPHRIDTPAGVVGATLHIDERVQCKTFLPIERKKVTFYSSTVSKVVGASPGRESVLLNRESRPANQLGESRGVNRLLHQS